MTIPSLKLFFAAAMAAAFFAGVSAPATAQHGAVYDVPDGPSPAAAQPGVDAFYRMFEGEVPNLDLPEARAIQFGKAAVELETAPTLDNRRIPAGFTFLGQFLDHDMTLNAGKTVGAASALLPDDQVVNSRSGTFDLDSVYGNTVERTITQLRSAIAGGVCTSAGATGCVPVEEGNDSSLLALYELDAGGRPTGRFRIAEHSAGVPDLPRCSDVPFALQCALPVKDMDGDGDVDAEDEAKHLLIAITGDKRNDENVIVAQLHLLFLRAHNKLYEMHRGVAAGAPVVFNESSFRFARRMLTEHYQSIIRDEYVPLTIGRDRAAGIRKYGFFIYNRPNSTAPFCTDDAAPIPHEFAVAAFRFGHSQVRPGYGLNTGAGGGGGFANLFGAQAITPQRQIDWNLFFALPGATPQLSKKIDTIISRPLGEMRAPVAVEPGTKPPDDNLGVRNVARTSRAANPPIPPPEGVSEKFGQRFPIGGGRAIAEEIRSRNIPEINLSILTEDQVEGATFLKGNQLVDAFGGVMPTLSELPLWTYVLIEAEAFNDGMFLGPVGGEIVGEVFLGLIQCDDAGISRDPFWTPSLPSSAGDSFSMADLIRFVGG